MTEPLQQILALLNTYLHHVGDHVKRDVGEGLVEVAANHTDPGERVPCVRARLI